MLKKNSKCKWFYSKICQHAMLTIKKNHINPSNCKLYQRVQNQLHGTMKEELIIPLNL